MYKVYSSVYFVSESQTFSHRLFRVGNVVSDELDNGQCNSLSPVEKYKSLGISDYAL
jgi:hypothetical protein